MNLGLLGIGHDGWLGGIYYVSNLINALASLPKEEQPNLSLILSNRGTKNFYREVGKKVRIILTDSLSQRLADKIYQVVLPKTLLFAGETKRKKYPPRSMERRLKKKNISLIFPCKKSLGSDFPIPWLGWAYDFQHKYYPEFFSPEQCEMRDRVFSSLLKEAPLTVISSHTAFDDFDRFFPGYRSRMRILRFRTYPSVSYFKGNPVFYLSKYKLPEKFLIIPNQFWVHKNHQKAFEAIKILVDRRKDVYLVCTGHVHDPRQPNYYANLLNSIKINHMENRIIILGLIPRYDQIQLLRKAMAVIQPSLFEGWSTVAEDARMLGKSLFISNLPVHQEQSVPRAIYFEPNDSEDLAFKLESNLSDLYPGPDYKKEEEACLTQQKLVTEYASQFLKIVREVLA